MATVKIDKFGGIAPRQHPTQLADGMATVAMNVKLESGKLVPLRQPATALGVGLLLEGGLGDVQDAETAHVWRKADGSFDFLLFGGKTWTAPGNVADDDLTRLIVSGDRNGDGAVEAPVLYMRGQGGVETAPIIKKPLDEPVVKRDENAPALDTGIVRYTRFVWAWVDANGMESPISPPSKNYAEDSQQQETTPIDDDLAYLDGDTIFFKKPAPPTGVTFASDYKIRVYKVLTGTQTGQMQFVGDQSWGSLSDENVTGFSLRVKDENAGEVMPELENAPDDLSNILAVPGSFYVGFSPSKAKTVCFSDVDLLYSWPEIYRYDIADNIVALAVTSNSVFALTDGWPYVLSGTAPESMTVAKLASPAACVSPLGVCVLNNAVYFASNDGLMAIANSATEGTVVTNVTEQVFTKEQWQALNPASCILGRHKGRLVLFFRLADGGRRGFMLNFSDGMSVAVTQHDEGATCVCMDDATGEMYFIREEA